MPTPPPAVPYALNPETAPRLLSEEEKANITKDRELEDLRRADEGKAKFKIELMFTAEFSVIKPVQGVMSFWESGTQFHGGGDTLVHFCPGKARGVNDCSHYIPDPNNGFGILVCPRCQKVWKGKDVIGQFMARLPAMKWAEVICSYYKQLDMNCDVVIKYHRNDIRSAMRAKHIEDTLRTVRSAPKRLKRIYTLKSILRDTSAGSTLYDRIRAFVVA